MTAEIAIMNKHAIALAADSAVTAGEKIFQSANKIFALSKSYPIGIMVYASASFCGIPWETLIKDYRRNYPNIKFNTLHSYALHFFKFLETNPVINRIKIPDEELVAGITEDFIKYMNDKLQKILKEINKGKIKVKEDILKHQTRVILIDILNEIRKLESGRLKRKLSYKIFKDNFLTIIYDIYDKYNISDLEQFIPLLKRIFLRTIYLALTAKLFNNNSGVVFAGFGEKELYPKLEGYLVGISILKQLQLTQTHNISIKENMRASVTPFAQSDIISLFMTGIHPDMYESLNDMYLYILKEHSSLITDYLKVSKRKVNKFKDKLNDINIEITQKIKENMTNVQREFWKPTIYTISIMEPIEIARLADSLVSITSVHRKVSLPRETVGGPTDVALISKGDGFVWIKRKHYFDPNINLDYLNRQNGEKKHG